MSRRSKDLKEWTAGPRVFDKSPEWTAQAVPANRGHFWAPDLIHHNGRFLLYYSVSTFGKNTSAIGLATNATLDPADPNFAWKDEGIVIQSTANDDFNAIDPAVVRDHEGGLWMSFGSFWKGIMLIQLDPTTGKRIAPDSPIHTLAYKREIEAPFIHYRDGYYYLFVNWGFCCRGVRSTYNIRVGRSTSITGPYLDQDGVDLAKEGGTLMMGTDGRFIGPGHAGIVSRNGADFLSYHFYDAQSAPRPGMATLGVRRLFWRSDGWPTLSREASVAKSSDAAPTAR
jgi:arabinan endo-1,5-alpha-L-arabinosidase